MQNKKRPKNQRNLSKKVERTPDLDIDDFTRSCDDLSELCKIIKDQKDSTRKLLKNFVKIRLVSIVEFNLKGFISDIIDRQNLDPKQILDEDSIIIDLDILQNFKKDEYTNGKIVIAHLDKMNRGIVYTIMKKINQLDVFKWTDQLLGLPNKTFWNEFKGLYRERNDLTHNLIDTDDSVETLKGKIEIMSSLIMSLYIFTNLNIDIYDNNHPESVIEKKYSKLLNRAGMTEKKFRQITKPMREKYKIDNSRNRKY